MVKMIFFIVKRMQYGLFKHSDFEDFNDFLEIFNF